MMKKVFHALIAIGSAIFYVGALIFVFGQAVCMLIGQPALVTAIETNVDAIIFPVISMVGVLCWIYSLIWKKKGKKSES